MWPVRFSLSHHLGATTDTGPADGVPYEMLAVSTMDSYRFIRCASDRLIVITPIQGDVVQVVADNKLQILI